jgi:type II secretory pathway predicted ATPase ExeA
VYLSYFQLQREPFAINPDSDFLWLSAKHAAVLETLKAGLLTGAGAVLLTGDIGTGKTILLKRLSRLDEVAVIFVTIHDLSLSRLDFCNALAVDCGLNQRFDRREAFYECFRRALAERFSADQQVLIVIDEAQRMNSEVLQETVELAENVQAAGRKPLKVILVGPLDFHHALTNEENRGVLQKIKTHCRLDPLTEKETFQYVGHRLLAAGRTSKLFTDDALKEVHALSRGYPRLINILCDHALLYGYGASLQEINGSVVRECSRDLEMALDIEPQPDVGNMAPEIKSSATPLADAASRSNRPLIYLAVVGALVATAFFLLTR